MLYFQNIKLYSLANLAKNCHSKNNFRNLFFLIHVCDSETENFFRGIIKITKQKIVQ